MFEEGCPWWLLWFLIICYIINCIVKECGGSMRLTDEEVKEYHNGKDSSVRRTKKR